jgi:hypothetical protein
MQSSLIASSPNRAFLLQFAFAVALAAVFVSIGFIPAGSGSQSILYDSFSGHFLGYVIITVFARLGPLQLPPAFWYAFYLLFTLGYLLLLTLPTYFYFRCRRSWLISVQLFAIAVHAAIAVFIVTPWWRHQ